MNLLFGLSSKDNVSSLMDLFDDNMDLSVEFEFEYVFIFYKI